MVVPAAWYMAPAQAGFTSSCLVPWKWNCYWDPCETQHFFTNEHFWMGFLIAYFCIWIHKKEEDGTMLSCTHIPLWPPSLSSISQSCIQEDADTVLKPEDFILNLTRKISLWPQQIWVLKEKLKLLEVSFFPSLPLHHHPLPELKDIKKFFLEKANGDFCFSSTSCQLSTRVNFTSWPLVTFIFCQKAASDSDENLPGREPEPDAAHLLPLPLQFSAPPSVQNLLPVP